MRAYAARTSEFRRIAGQVAQAPSIGSIKLVHWQQFARAAQIVVKNELAVDLFAALDKKIGLLQSQAVALGVRRASPCPRGVFSFCFSWDAVDICSDFVI